MNRDINNIAESYKQVLESKQPTKEQLQATKNYLKAFGLPSDETTVSQVSQNSLQMKLPVNPQNRTTAGTSNYKEVLGQLADAASGTEALQGQHQQNDNIPITGPGGVNPEFSKQMQQPVPDNIDTEVSKQKQQHTPYYYNTYQFPNLPETIEGEPGNPRRDDFNKPRQTSDDLFNIFRSAFSP